MPVASTKKRADPHWRGARAVGFDPAGTHPGHAMKILVVDDDVSFVDMLEAFLRQEGYITQRAHNSRDAVEKNKAFLPEIILLDLRLESGSGLHLLPDLLVENTRAAVVILTGYPSARTAVEALNKGAAGYLEKPLDLEQLKELLAGHVSALP